MTFEEVVAQECVKIGKGLGKGQWECMKIGNRHTFG